MKKNNIVKGIAAGVGAAVIAIGFSLGGGLVGYNMYEPKEVEVPVEVIKEVPVEVVKEVEVIKEVPKNVTVEVPVEDTEFLKVSCDKLMYNDISECKEEVTAEDEAITLAIEEVKSEFADVLEDEGLVVDEDDVELVRVYDDFEDIDVLKSDYDDKEYRFEIRVKIDDDVSDDKKYFLFEVDVEDGEASIKNVVEE